MQTSTIIIIFLILVQVLVLLSFSTLEHVWKIVQINITGGLVKSL